MAEIEIKSAETPQVAPDTAPQRPEHIPEKFWDAATGTVRQDDLAKAYGELSKKLGDPTAAKDPVVETPAADDDAAQNAAAEAAGINVAAMEEEFAENGVLSDDSYAKFAAAGIDRTIVDEVIALRTQKAETARTELMASIGGEQAYTEAVEWAATNWSKAQVSTYNDAVNSGDMQKMQLAVKALAADFNATKKSAKPNLLKPTSSASAANSDRYESLAQLMADQRDPRYGVDPAFTKNVENKLARSNNI